MFKDVISRDNGTPWPATGMTSEKWLSVPLEVVLISELIATQPGVYFEALMHPTTPVGGDGLPHVILWRGDMYLEDGHTRVFRAWSKGMEDVVVRVLKIEED